METQADDTQVKPESSDNAPQPEPQLSEWEQKFKNAEDNPFNEAAWNALLDLAEESGDLEKIKEAYEALLAKYPNIVRNIFILSIKLFVTRNSV